MTTKEIRDLKNALCFCKLDNTFDRVINYENLKKDFKQIKPYVDEMKNKLYLGLMNMKEFSTELSYSIGKECSEKQSLLYLLISDIFLYDNDDEPSVKLSFEMGTAVDDPNLPYPYPVLIAETAGFKYVIFQLLHRDDVLKINNVFEAKVNSKTLAFGDLYKCLDACNRHISEFIDKENV